MFIMSAVQGVYGYAVKVYNAKSELEFLLGREPSPVVLCLNRLDSSGLRAVCRYVKRQNQKGESSCLWKR